MCPYHSGVCDPALVTVDVVSDVMPLVASFTQINVFLCRYDSYGRLTNITYPTGRVSSYRTGADSSVHIQTEGSNKEDITITTNLSASGTFYTLMQGESPFTAMWLHLICEVFCVSASD